MFRRIARTALFALAGLVLFACGLQIAGSASTPVPPREESNVRLATLNVHWVALRMQSGPWSPAGWDARRPAMAATLLDISPDILALQEAESFPDTNRNGRNLVVEGLMEDLDGYAIAATGPPTEFPPTQPILYRADRFEMVDQGWFFFSRTPDRIYSRTFNGGFAAFASWAQFRGRDGGLFRVVNMHTDYASRSNRLKSAALVRDRVRPWIEAGERVVVLGDMNAMRGAATLRRIEEAGIRFLPIPGATVHFNRGINLLGAIDHIGLGPGLKAVSQPGVVRNRVDGVWPSDHYPVFVDLATDPEPGN